MRVFMLGWEFPPHISGGLGTACYGMTKALDEIGVEVCFVVPTPVPLDSSSHVDLKSPQDLAALRDAPATPVPASPADGPAKIVSSDAARIEARRVMEQHVQMHHVPAILQAYGTQTSFSKILESMTREQRIEIFKLMPQLAGAGETKDTEAIQHAIETGSFDELDDISEPDGNDSFAQDGQGAHYAGDLMTQVQRYASLAVKIAKSQKFDVIHAHDWMTYPAGLAVAAATGKPLVVHVHSTEFDRSGETPDQRVYEIERRGMHGANRVICVSFLTRNIAITRYGIDPAKAEVVYNAVELPDDNGKFDTKPIGRHEKIVLFLGRVTMQKGPEYFLEAAKKVVERYSNVRFVMAGSGDMIAQCIQQAADLRLGKYVTFTGFLRGNDVARIFKMADLYVMPSVSEPFGIAPLEAMSHDVPVIISKQSGVSEVLTHVLKVDFWDVDEMANKILAVLRHPPLQRTLRQHGAIELQKISWLDSAKQLESIYTSMAAQN